MVKTWAWRPRRSNSAMVHFSSPNTCTHSPKERLVVRRVERVSLRSESWSKRSSPSGIKPSSSWIRRSTRLKRRRRSVLVDLARQLQILESLYIQGAFQPHAFRAEEGDYLAVVEHGVPFLRAKDNRVRACANRDAAHSVVKRAQDSPSSGEFSKLPGLKERTPCPLSNHTSSTPSGNSFAPCCPRGKRIIRSVVIVPAYPIGWSSRSWLPSFSSLSQSPLRG